MATLEAYPHSRLQNVAIGIIIGFASITLLVVVLRVYSRITKKQLGLDDALVCVAMLFEIAQTFTSYMCVRTMFIGIHITNVPPDMTMTTGMLWNFAAQLVYNPILACVKCSVLHFLLRLGGGLDKKTRWVIYGVGTITILQMCIIFVVLGVQCNPIEYYWTQYSLDPVRGTCIDLPAFYISTASITVVTDLLVLALPIWMFLGLNMRMKLKAMVMSLFLLGGGATVASILRLVWLVQLYYYPVVDSTHDIRFVYVEIETCLAIIAASGPALKPLAMKWFPRLFSISGHSSNKMSKCNGNDNKASTNVRTTVSILTHSGTPGTQSFALRDLRHGQDRELRDKSPTGSEEEIMTYHGIMRTREYTVIYGDEDEEDDQSPLAQDTSPLRSSAKHKIKPKI
ncbi:hypothetical protein N0V93_002146 [Gnomoniopsis smithogilvyi]|uniref:Rhodopsin domain-containing protein n=1 Tax=Gnomoniopsis smithogilvyi TaxID=1191159 RepID=A0A9W8YUS1_9PEZI|nr:hypothetical protein N0V93_002146 [Gnomoniopsis smithogilvyi]